jgi:hypothetical protein
MHEAAVQMRYREFTRRTGRTETADSVREFLHLEILRILSALDVRGLILHGGCKTRYIDGSPRYSMDMDFSLSDFRDTPREERAPAVHRAIDPVIRELGNLGIELKPVREQWHRGETGVKLCFKANVLKDMFPKIFVGHPGDVNLNIDVDALQAGESVEVSSPIADHSLRILVLQDSSHMARKAAAVLLRKQLRDLYDLDMYINRGIRYDLAIVRHRLHMPELSHEELVSLLCQRIGELDLEGRAHQLHLPTESERTSFVVASERIANIERMRPQ